MSEYLDLAGGVSLLALGVLAEAQGVEGEVTGSAARTLRLVKHCSTSEQLQHTHNEQQETNLKRRMESKLYKQYNRMNERMITPWIRSPQQQCGQQGS